MKRHTPAPTPTDILMRRGSPTTRAWYPEHEPRPSTKVTVQRQPLFRWTPSSTGPGRWVICFGPQMRWGVGMPSSRQMLALTLGDTERMQGCSWYDPLRRTWRFDWPAWLWPADQRRVSRLVLELAAKHGVTPRLALNRLRARS